METQAVEVDHIWDESVRPRHDGRGERIGEERKVNASAGESPLDACVRSRSDPCWRFLDVQIKSVRIVHHLLEKTCQMSYCIHASGRCFYAKSLALHSCLIGSCIPGNRTHDLGVASATAKNYVFTLVLFSRTHI